jgi:hypothetical protein
MKQRGLALLVVLCVGIGATGMSGQVKAEKKKKCMMFPPVCWETKLRR